MSYHDDFYFVRVDKPIRRNNPFLKNLTDEEVRKEIEKFSTDSFAIEGIKDLENNDEDTSPRGRC